MELRVASKAVALLLLCMFVLLFAAPMTEREGGGKPVPPSKLFGTLYPTWAHHHWVWLCSSVANQSSEIDLVNGYLSYNIPVGAVDVDSQWATGDNDFIWNTEKYPEPQNMIDYFHSLDIRVILWTTSLVDTDSPNYQYGYDNDYYLNHGRTVNWWHGTGSFIDYTNPNAVEWWHSQLDNVIDMGIDGWKCDGTDPYVFELIDPQGYAGHVSEREYANLYYGDFFNYTQSKNPEALIMSRPVDSWHVIYWSFSPKFVMYSGWVGDQDPDFSGLRDALRNMFHSAWRDYANYGSDIGGYRSSDNYGPLGRTKELFIRWAQLGAFCPLMENGGNGEHRPWMFDNTNQTVDIYRQFVFFHYEMGPYFLNAGSTAMEQGISVMYPQANKTDLVPDSWSYMLWKDIFVAPIVENSTTRAITFPTGNNWINWWDISTTYAGGSSVSLDYPLEQFPVFIREGAMLALNVTSSFGTGWGDERSAGYLTLFVPKPTIDGGYQAVREYKGVGQEFWYFFNEKMNGEYSLSFVATAHSRKVIYLVKNLPFAPRRVVDRIRDFSALPEFRGDDDAHSKMLFDDAEFGWRFSSSGDLWIKVSDLSSGLRLSIS